MVTEVREEERSILIEVYAMTDIEYSEIPLLTDDATSALQQRREKEMKLLQHNLGCRLLNAKPIISAFPRCSDILLSQAVLPVENLSSGKNEDDVKEHFNEYFAFREHRIFPNFARNKLPEGVLKKCTSKWFPRKCFENNGTYLRSETHSQCCIETTPWPSPWCLGHSCVTLEGIRRLPKISNPQQPYYEEITISAILEHKDSGAFSEIADRKFNFENVGEKGKISFTGPMTKDTRKLLMSLCDRITDPNYATVIDDIYRGYYVKRLFIADLVWLYYFERMGIFKIMGVILDDFATNGKIPMSNNTLSAFVMETMVRLMKNGLSSTVRDRDSSYRRCLGWTSDVGRKLESGAKVNVGFNNLFHKFIKAALDYYKDRRLATAIQSQTSPGKASVATLITIGDPMNVLKKAFDPFDYGRNYANTLNGIIWAIAGMALIRELRATLGIPTEYNEPYEYIPAAYDLLVSNKQIATSESNRYVLHRECAIDARDMLLDIQFLNSEDSQFGRPGGELEIWLDSVEDRVEGYRTAYRSVTGIDLGEQGTPRVEQQV